MSFKKDEYESYLKNKGLKSFRTYCSYLRRIQREFKLDIDIEYGRDGCAALFGSLDAKLAENKASGKKNNLKRKKYNALRQMRNSLKKYIAFRRDEAKPRLLSKETEEKLRVNDRPVKKDVMVGTVRDTLQLEFILKYNSYYVPAHFITEDRLPIRYIALHEQGIGSEPGIRRYGEVITAQKIKRSRIPVPTSRNNGDEPYYYFKVRRWETLPRPISIRDTYRGRPLFTSKFLLDNCTQSYQLFSVSSEKDYRLMSAINKAFDDMRDFGPESFSAVYPINEAYTLTVFEGFFSVVNGKDETVERISVGSFSYRPRDGFNKLKKVINAQ